MAPSIGGQQSVAVMKCVGDVLGFVKKTKKALTENGLCDNFILKLHHTYSFYVYISLYLVVLQQWYNRDMMICSNKYNADLPIREDLMNICYTYMYLPEPNNSRRYLFWYRYLQFVLLGIAGLYYWIHKLVKYTEDQHTKRLITEIQPMDGKCNPRQDNELDKIVNNRVPEYLSRTMRCNQSIYWKNLGLTVLALVIDIFVMCVFDYILNGRFFQYLYQIIPFERDTVNFTDFMSRTFPPFVECEINKLHKLTSERSDIMGCHLPQMELYEKIFVFYWLWLAFLIVACIFHIVYLLAFLIPVIRRSRFLNGGYSTPACGFDDDGGKLYDDQIKKFIGRLSYSDGYVLKRLKGHISEMRYFVVLLKMVELKNKEEGDTDSTGSTSVGSSSYSIEDEDETRRRGNMPKGADKGMGMEGPNGAACGWMLDARQGRGPILS